MKAGDYVRQILSAKSKEKRNELLHQTPRHLREAIKKMVENEFNKRKHK